MREPKQLHTVIGFPNINNDLKKMCQDWSCLGLNKETTIKKADASCIYPVLRYQKNEVNWQMDMFKKKC